MADAVEAPGLASSGSLENESEAAIPAADPKEEAEVMNHDLAAAEERSVASDVGETLGAEGGEDEENGDSSVDEDDGEGVEEPEDGLARADQLFEKGSKAIEEGDFVEAVDCLSRALEIRAAHFGELAPECASSYYKYGCALLYKAQEEADPLVHIPKDSEKNSSRATAIEIGESSSGTKILIADDEKQEKEGKQVEGVDGSSDKEVEDNDDEDMGDGDEDDSDLDLAWKMLDIARAIIEKCPEDTMEKVNILSALGEVAVEREDIETSLNDYLKALSILGNLVEPNHRRIIELNFRICLVLELGSKIEEAIPYCKKASVLCESRVQHLKEDLASLKGSTNQQTPKISEKEKEIESIDGILTELEKKLEDLQQVLLNPKPLFEEMMKMITSGPPNPETNSSPSFSSSRLSALVNGSSSSDSSTFSTAATSGGEVTHLGVVGRGLKRASLTPIPVDSSSEKKSKAFEESSLEKVNSGLPEIVDFPASLKK